MDRNALLMELIDKMQTRLADKEYPTEKAEEPIEDAVAEVMETKTDAPVEEEISDEDVAALSQEVGE